jgi:hypothetical protein
MVSLSPGAPGEAGGTGIGTGAAANRGGIAATQGRDVKLRLRPRISHADVTNSFKTIQASQYGRPQLLF